MNKQTHLTHQEANSLIQSILDNATPTQANDLAHRVFERMGLDLQLPKSALLHPCLNYRLGTDEVLGQFPALVLPMFDKWGNYRALEVLFLGAPGEVAPVVQPRHIYWVNGIEAGVFIPLQAPVDGVMGVAAHLGSAIAANHLTGVPMCAVCSASDLARFQIPPEVSTLVIFADCATEQEAMALHARAQEQGISSQVVMPPTPNANWLTEFAFRGAIPVDEIADSKSVSGNNANPL